MQLADLPEIVDLIMDAKEEGYPQYKKVVVEKISNQVFTAFNQGLSFVIRKDDEIIGIVGYGMIPSWHSDEKQFMSLWFYTKPKYRNLKNFKLLLSSAELLKPFGRVFIGMDTKKDAVRKHKLFNRYLKTEGVIYEA